MKPKHEQEYVPHTGQDRHYSQNVGNVRYIWKRVPAPVPGTTECSCSPRDEVADLCHSTSLGFLSLAIPQTRRNSSASKTEKMYISDSSYVMNIKQSQLSLMTNCSPVDLKHGSSSLLPNGFYFLSMKCFLRFIICYSKIKTGHKRVIMGRCKYSCKYSRCVSAYLPYLFLDLGPPFRSDVFACPPLLPCWL